jgi:hypothetical protein
MELKLYRKHLKPLYTIGKLYINDEYFCDTLEDTVRDTNHDGVNEEKIYGKTAIPYGKYKVDITYSYKFKKEMPILLNVPGFEGIRIHSGNTPEHTEGCILVGFNKKVGQVNDSYLTYLELFAQLKEVHDKSETINIEIV